jgi:Resolvase, N terminal domain/Helix-turn-helix domain of resolvase
MVLSVATKVFMPEIELANRYGSLARVARRHLIDLSPQAWKASCRMRETTASRGALGTFRTAAGKYFLDMLGVFAEFETNLRRERQLEGIAKAKAAGVYKGRPASIDVTKVRQLKAQGMGASEIAKALKISRASVYRALGQRAQPGGRPQGTIRPMW